MSAFDQPVNRSATNSIKWDLKPRTGSGRDRLPMWVADMDFAGLPEVQEAIRRRADHPVFGYTFASDEYRASFLEWQRKRNGWSIHPSHLLFASGVLPAVRAAVLGLTEPGDGVVLQTPVYYPFYSVITGNGRAVVDNPLLHTEEGYRLDLDDLDAKLTPRTRMLLLCSPHNPVGRVWSREELQAIVELAKRHDLTIVSDEIHADIVMPGSSFTPLLSLPGAEERTIACHAPSKTFNLAGLSSASIIVPDASLRNTFNQTLERLGMTLPNVFSLVAAHAAYTYGEPWLDELLAYLAEQIDWFSGELHARFRGRIRLTPIEGTYLAWLDCRPLLAATGSSHQAFLQILMDEAGLWLSDGCQFGDAGEGFFRLNLATPRPNVVEGLARLEEAVRIAALRSTEDKGAVE